MYASSVVDVICSDGRRRARTKICDTCFHSLCFQILTRTRVLGFFPSPGAYMSYVQKCSLFNTDDWRGKKKILDEKEGEGLCYVPISLETENVGGIFLKNIWPNCSGLTRLGLWLPRKYGILFRSRSHGQIWRMVREARRRTSN